MKRVKGKVTKWIRATGSIAFYPGGTLGFAVPLARNEVFTIGKYKIPYVAQNGNSKIWFHKNGNVRELHISKPITLKAHGKKMVFEHQPYCGGDLKFNQKGSLKFGVLHKPIKINGILYPRTTRLSWNKNGTLKNAAIYNSSFLVQGWKIGGVKTAFSHVYFYPNGKIRSITALGANRKYKGKLYKKGSDLYFNQDGTVY